MNLFLKIRKTIITGISEIVDIVKTSSFFEPISVMYVYTPSGKVRVKCELVIIIGHKNAFHEEMTFRIVVNRMVGRV